MARTHGSATQAMLDASLGLESNRVTATEINLMREDLANANQTVEVLQREIKRMQEVAKEIRDLDVARECVRRLHHNTALCSEDENAPWRAVGKEIFDTIIVPHECHPDYKRDTMILLQCSEYTKDVVHALFGVTRCDLPEADHAFKIVARKKRRRE